MNLTAQIDFLLSHNIVSTILAVVAIVEVVFLCYLNYRIYKYTVEEFYKSCLVMFTYLLVFVTFFNLLYLVTSNLYLLLIAVEVLIVNPKLIAVFKCRLDFLKKDNICLN